MGAVPRIVRSAEGAGRGLRPGPLPCYAPIGSARQLRPLPYILPKGGRGGRFAQRGHPRPGPQRGARSHSTATQNIYFVSFGAALKRSPQKTGPSGVQNMSFAQKYVKTSTAAPLGAGPGALLRPWFKVQLSPRRALRYKSQGC